MAMLAYVFREKPGHDKLTQIMRDFHSTLALYIGRDCARFVTPDGTRSPTNRIRPIEEFKEAIGEYGRMTQMHAKYNGERTGLVMAHPDNGGLVGLAIDEGVLPGDTIFKPERIQNHVDNEVRQLELDARWAAARLLNGDTEQVRRIMEEKTY